MKSMPSPRPLTGLFFRMLLFGELLPSLLIMLVTVGAAAYLGNGVIDRQRLENVNAISRSVDRYLNTAEDVLKTTADTLTALQNHEHLGVVLEMARKNHRYFDVLYVIDAQGREVWMTPADPLYPPGFDMSGQVYFKNKVQSQTGISEPFPSFRTGLPTAIMSVNLDNGGQLIGELSLQALQDEVDAWADDRHTTYIVDQSGYLLAHPNTDWVDQQKNIKTWEVVQRGFQGASHLFYTAEDGQLMRASTTLTRQGGWLVVREASLQAVYGMYIPPLFGAAALISTIWIGLVIFFQRRMQTQVVQPLQALSRATEIMATGSGGQTPEIAITNRAFLEIHELTHSFNRMNQAILSRQEALIDSENRLQKIIQDMPVILVALDHNRHVCVWNKEAERATGYSREDILQSPDPMQLIFPHEADRERIRQIVFTLSGDFRGMEWELTGKDGENHPIIWSSIAFSTPIPGWSFWMVGLDVTLLRRIEAASRLSSDKIQAMFSSAIDGILFVDLGGQIQDANQAAVDMFHCGDHQDLIGHNMIERVIPADRDRARKDRAYTLDAGRLIKSEYRCLTMDGGELDVETSAALLRDMESAPIGFVFILRDITERKAIEAEIHRLNRDLEQRVMERTSQLDVSNRELESFSYSVSHDLRTPLRSLDGFSHILLEDYAEKLDETGRDYLKRISKAAQRMASLVDALLKLARITRAEINYSLVNLSSIADHYLAEQRAAYPERQVEIKVEQGMLVEADASLMEIVMENLLDNAWKFTAAQVPARIEVGRAAAEEENLTFFVRDNGAGFDMNFSSKLFGAFQRLHDGDEFSGVGIGLAMVLRIVQRHGGKIWARGSLNQGATFYFSLPCRGTRPPPGGNEQPYHSDCQADRAR